MEKGRSLWSCILILFGLLHLVADGFIVYLFIWNRSLNVPFIYQYESLNFSKIMEGYFNLNEIKFTKENEEISKNIPLVNSYDFVLAADLDLNSRHSEKFLWYSILKKGTLYRNSVGNFTIKWNEEFNISTTTATNNRSMEISELIMWQHNLLGFCDYTGMAYKISSDGQVFQRYALADGNGKEPKPFKVEWATEKDGFLYIGSIGKEWIVNGKLLHTNAEWVKVIDKCGLIENFNWSTNYQFLRNVTNTTFPGYLIHEAVVWNPVIRKWIFLPRRASAIPYSPSIDEHQGTNLMVIVDEFFTSATVKTIGRFEPEWGFSSVKIIPDTNELLAIKIYEVEKEMKTEITLFDIEGNFKLEPAWITVSDKVKFEGLEFL